MERKKNSLQITGSSVYDVYVWHCMFIKLQPKMSVSFVIVVVQKGKTIACNKITIIFENLVIVNMAKQCANCCTYINGYFYYTIINKSGNRTQATIESNAFPFMPLCHDERKKRQNKQKRNLKSKECVCRARGAVRCGAFDS